MKKKLVSLLLMLAMFMPTLAACGNAVPEETESGTEPPVAEETNTPEKVSDTVNLVKDGVSEYVIVRGENAYISEVTASTELQAYLLKITGTELPIVTDATPAVEKEIVVGKTNREAEGDFDRDELGTDGFVIKTEDGKLWLVGGEKRGTLYAVYEFLEAYLGCRFYTWNFEKVPELKTVSLEIAEDKQIPVFPARFTSWSDQDSGNYQAAKRKQNATGNPAETGGNEQIYGHCHSLPKLAEVGDGSSKDPCLLLPETYDTVLKNVRATLDANPSIKILDVSQGDNNHCTCSDCVARAAEIGWTAYYLEFYNRLAEEIADEYSDVLLHIFAYRHTLPTPQTDIVPADNILVRFCTIEGCFAHPLKDGCEVNGNISADYLPEGEGAMSWKSTLDAWSEICDNLAIWDYTANFNEYNILHPNFHVLRENLQFFAEYNIIFLYEQGLSGLTNGEFAELRSYLLTKLMWDPYVSEEEYYSWMDEFLADYYGPGWQYIREYIDAGTEYAKDLNKLGIWGDLEKLYPAAELETIKESDTIPTFTADELRNAVAEDWLQYCPWLETRTITQPVIAKGFECFAAAMEMAETEEQYAHLDKSFLHLEYMHSIFYKRLLTMAQDILNDAYKLAVNNAQTAGEIVQNEGTTLKLAFKKEVKSILMDEYNKSFKELMQKFLNYGVYWLTENFDIRERV